MSDYRERRIGVRDEHEPKFGRQVLTIWSGAFAYDYDGWALELPGHNGYMLTIDRMLSHEKIRVECPSPRTEANYEQVDAAIQAAFTAAEIAYGERMDALRAAKQAGQVLAASVMAEGERG